MRSEINDLIKFLGSLIVSLIITSIPILATLSWVLNWSIPYRFLFSLAVVGYLFYFTAIFYINVDKEKE